MSDDPVGIIGEESVAQAGAVALALEGFIQAVAKEQKFTEFTREILVAVMGAVRCEAGSILEVDARTNTLFFRAVVGQSSEKISDFVVPMGQGIVGHVAESRQALIVDNAKDNSLHLQSIPDSVGFAPRNIIAVPIIVRGKTFGVLELLNRVGETAFTSSDLQLLTRLCQKAALLIEVRLMIAWAMQSKQAAPSGGQEAA